MMILIGVFVLVFATSVIAWFAMSNAARKSDVDKVRARLEATPEKKSKGSGKVALFEVEEKPKGNLIPRLMEKYDIPAKLKTLGEQAGTRVDPVKFVHISLGSFLLGYFMVYFLLPPSFAVIGLPVAALFAAVPTLNLIRKRDKRLGAFEEVFPDALEFISRSMRAGHAFSVSLEMIHKEFQDPLAGEFRRAFEEHNLGLPLEVALQGMARRIPLLDVGFFVSAVLLQKRTGGNLAEILDKLAYVIRERFKLRGRIKAIAAHGKMTGTALTSIPLAVGALMFFVNPDYVKFFVNDPTGNIMIGGAIGMQILGYMIIQKIVKIEV
ncbi:MAG: type II secretion system F family protein [Bryobacteraceae bacterium]|nr:type II secretion system F family protein [Bryobacteraceae bacterium]